jgi:surfeit locus 1 family protein
VSALVVHRPVLLAVLALLGVVVLTGLGVWQLQRLASKEALIAERTARIKSPPLPLADVLARARTGGDIDYLMVRLDGRFSPATLRQFSTRGGPPAWELVSPFTTTGGEVVLVARGLLADGETGLPPPPEGAVTLEGLVRRHEARGMFTPQNAPEKNQWYWWDVPAMARAAGLPDGAAPMLTVDQIWPVPPDLQPLTPVLNLSNRHLGYALTWFGLAATLVAVAAAYLLAGRRGRASA